MVLDDFIFHVSKVWYRIFWTFMVALNCAIVIGYLVGKFNLLPQITPQLDRLNLTNMITCVLSSLALAYLVGAYWLVLRWGIALATLVGAMFNALVLLNGIINTNTGPAAWIYVGLWLVTTVLSGSFGLLGMLGPALLGSMY